MASNRDVFPEAFNPSNAFLSPRASVKEQFEMAGRVPPGKVTVNESTMRSGDVVFIRILEKN
jgi:hypothetical protein